MWKIRNFPGGKEYLLRCKFGLPSVAAEEEAPGRMPPIRVGYEIPYFTVSGIQVQQPFQRHRCFAGHPLVSGHLSSYSYALQT